MIWPGPWTYTDPNDGQVKRLPAGNYAVVVKAMAGNSSPQREVVSGPYDKVSLVEVKKIELLECGSPGLPSCQDGGVELEENNDSKGVPMPGGGKAAFPDATASNGGYRRTVLVKAELDPDLGPDASFVTVHFKWFDVDDPSAGRNNGNAINDPVDNDLVAGPDNRREDAIIVESTQATPGLAGAISYFRVSTTQGNNYRVAASTHRPWLADLCGVVSNTTGELVHGPCTTSSNGTALSTDPWNNEAAMVSEMLTVWRTLHLELDKIDPVGAGVTQASLDQHRDWTDLKARKLINRAPGVFDADHTQDDDWLGARLLLDFHPQHSYRVKSNGSDKVAVKVPSNTPNLLNGQRPRDITDRGYVLRDDELQRFLDVVHDTGMLAGLLDQVYVRVRRHEGDAVNPNTLLPWPPPPSRVLTSGVVLGWPRDTISSKPFWAVPLALAFEGRREDVPNAREDERRDTGDPSNYSAVIEGKRRYLSGLLGVSYPGSGGALTQPRSLSFVETMRDFKETNTTPARPTVTLTEMYASNAAHETLHSLTLGHRGGIMCANRKNDTSDPMRFSLTRKQLSELRDIEQPSLTTQQPAICGEHGATPPDCCPQR